MSRRAAVWLGVARRLFVRFPTDEPWPAPIATPGTAVFMNTAGVILGGLGSSIAEVIQVGDMHLNYRAERLPWNHDWPFLFAAGLVLFSLIATIRWR